MKKLTKLEHKNRIDKKREAYKSALDTMLKIESIRGVSDGFHDGSVFKKGMANLDSELRCKTIKLDLEVYLQEAIDAGYPELTI